MGSPFGKVLVTWLQVLRFPTFGYMDVSEELQGGIYACREAQYL